MDSWTNAQISIMKHGGNTSCNDYLSKQGTLPSTTSSRLKYDNEHAQFYKELLKARAAGLPEPKSLPISNASTRSTNKTIGRLNGESDDECAGRRLALRQEETKARMRAKFGSNGMAGIGSDSSYNPHASATRSYSLISISCMIIIAGGSLYCYFCSIS